MSTEEAVLLARGLGRDGFASDMDNPVVRTTFNHRVDAGVISVNAFRETALDIMDFGEGATEAVIDRALYQSARTVTGKEALGRIGIPFDEIGRLSSFSSSSELEEYLDNLE